MRAFKAFLAIAIVTSPLTCLGVDVAITTGLQQTEVRETGVAGQRLDKETGNLPFVEIGLSTMIDYDFVLSTQHRLSLGDIAYDGQLQNGLPYQTVTQTQFRSHSLGLSSPIIASWFDGDQRIISSLGYHLWQRDIIGKQGVNSLYESYEWKSLELGINHSSAAKDIKLSLSAYKTFDGNMRISIPNTGDGNITLPQGNGIIVKGRISNLRKSNCACIYWHQS